MHQPPHQTSDHHTSDHHTHDHHTFHHHTSHHHTTDHHSSHHYTSHHHTSHHHSSDHHTSDHHKTSELSLLTVRKRKAESLLVQCFYQFWTKFGSLNPKWAALQFFIQFFWCNIISRTRTSVNTSEELMRLWRSKNIVQNLPKVWPFNLKVLTSNIKHVEDKIADIVHVLKDLVERRYPRRYDYDHVRSLLSCYYC